MVAVAMFVLPLPTARASIGRVGEATVVSGPLAFAYGYLTPIVTVKKGDPLRYSNLDLVAHDVVQDVAVDGTGGAKRKPWCAEFTGACPLFWSPRAPFQGSVGVKGVAALEPGTYSFYCTLHEGMKGKLVVQP